MMLAVSGVTAMDCKTTVVIAKLAVAALPPNTMTIFEFPTVILLAKPVMSTLATAGEEEVQFAVAIGCVVPSE
jgi:hypothetical protein